MQWFFDLHDPKHAGLISKPNVNTTTNASQHAPQVVFVTLGWFLFWLLFTTPPPPQMLLALVKSKTRADAGARKLLEALKALDPHHTNKVSRAKFEVLLYTAKAIRV